MQHTLNLKEHQWYSVTDVYCWYAVNWKWHRLRAIPKEMNLLATSLTKEYDLCAWCDSYCTLTRETGFSYNGNEFTLNIHWIEYLLLLKINLTDFVEMKCKRFHCSHFSFSYHLVLHMVLCLAHCLNSNNGQMILFRNQNHSIFQCNQCQNSISLDKFAQISTVLQGFSVLLYS